MRKSKQIVGMPVFSLEEGQQTGSVKDLVVNPQSKKVVALAIAQKGWLKELKYIPYSKIRSIGEDAITVDHGTTLEKGASLPEIVKLVREKVEVTGARLVTENGTILGLVDEYLIDLLTGEIVGLEFGDNFINSMIKGRAYLDINHIRTIGKEVIVCNEDALANLVKIDGGMGNTVRSLRDTTTQAWGSTVQLTRNLGTSLNRSLDRVRRNKPDESLEHHNCSCHTMEPVDNEPAAVAELPPNTAIEKPEASESLDTVALAPEDEQQPNLNDQDGSMTTIQPDGSDAKDEQAGTPRP